ncbi:MAG: DUF4091 domain-containing protein [Clostridia bacterium]|nr:DUF4091 domain-containing protein [Clostridia bacterium]
MLDIRLLNSLAKVWPDSEPDVLCSVSGGTMLKGERHNFQAAYRLTDKNQAGIGFRVESDLGEALSVRFVDNVPCDYTVPAGNEDVCEHPLPGLMPDILSPMPPVLWAYDKVWRSIWLTVDADRYEVSPGTHEIKVIFSDGEEQVLSYELKVFDYRLPELTLPVTNWFHSDGLCHFYKVEFASEEYWRIMENFAACAVKNGITLLLVPVFTPPLDTAQGGERLTTQLVEVKVNPDGSYGFGFELLKRYLDICRKAGVRYYEISHLFTQWGCRNAPKVIGTLPDGTKRRIFGWETDGTGPEYSAFLRAFLGALTPFLKDEGIFDKCYFHVSDEPDWSMKDQYSKGAALIREFVPKENIIDAMSDPRFYEEGLNKNPVAALTHIDSFIDLGIKETWGYYCCGQIRTSNRLVSTPSYRNRILGIQLFRYDIKGFLQWGFNFYNSFLSYESVDPFSSSTAHGWVPGGDPFVVYPGTGGEPWESIRLAVFAEALADYRALNALLDSGRAGSREDIVRLLGLDRFPFVDFKTSAAELIGIRDKVNELLAG